MNGVIINDERIHQESWRQLSKKYDFHLTEQDFTEHVFGKTEKDTFAYLFGKELTPAELEKHSAERVEIAIDLFTPQLALTDGLEDFLKELEKNSIPIAIATSARRTYTNFILDGLNIRHYFQKVVTSEDVTRGKPDPEIYLLAAKELGASPQNCIVFEDSLSGIKSGKAAGMKVIAITTTHKREELSSADKIIDSFSELSLTDLSNS